MSLLLGHRGFSTQYLENSMEAFRGALAAGMDPKIVGDGHRGG